MQAWHRKLALVLAVLAGIVGFFGMQSTTSLYNAIASADEIFGSIFLPAMLVWMIVIGIGWCIDKTFRKPLVPHVASQWALPNYLTLAVNGTFALLVLGFLATRGIRYAEQPFTASDLVVIILTAVTVILTALAIFLAVLGVLGFTTIRSEVQKVAAAHTVKYLSEVATRENQNPPPAQPEVNAPPGNGPLPNDERDSA